MIPVLALAAPPCIAVAVLALMRRRADRAEARRAARRRHPSARTVYPRSVDS